MHIDEIRKHWKSLLVDQINTSSFLSS